MTCSIGSCPGQGPFVRGYCQGHYRRLRRTGSVGSAPIGSPVAVSPGPPRRAVVTYSAAHYRVRTARGLASALTCAHCPEQAVDWAYDHRDPAARTELHRGRVIAYSCDPAHYLPMCRSCHAVFDDNRVGVS